MKEIRIKVRSLLMLGGALIFGVGMLIGQQRSRFDRYLRTGATKMDIAVVRANLEIIRLHTYQKLLSTAPSIDYYEDCACFRGQMMISSEDLKEPEEVLRLGMLGSATAAYGSLYGEIPDLLPIKPGRLFTMRFSEIGKGQHDIGEFVDGKVVLFK